MKTREENKKYYRDKILAASKEVFTAKGFENTTIEQIAGKAGIGIGTAYNYFKSKEELYILSMAEDVATNIEDSLEEFEYTQSDVSEIVADAILKYIRKMNWINKKIWKVAIPIIFSAVFL